MIDRTYIRARTTITVKPQKKPLIARIDGAFVAVTADASADEVSRANLKIVGIAKFVFRFVLPTHV
jgi:hypothetical protein